MQLDFDATRNRPGQTKQSAVVAQTNRSDFHRSPDWYGKCLKKSASAQQKARQDQGSSNSGGRRQVMTVLLVLAMFAIFLTIDHFYAKAKRPVLQVAPAMSKREAKAPRLTPSLVGGFSVPENLRYHPGHT
jgi:hypothetical protein